MALDQSLFDYLCAKKKGKEAPPYIPRFDPMPLAQACQLALLWFEAGFEREASDLAYWLSSSKEFSALWCPEKQFNEKEIEHGFALLAAKGKEPAGGWEPDFAPMIHRSASMSAAFTWAGNRGTSLGMVKAKGAAIRAFGPQDSSLRFGIQGKGERAQGWACCFALPEVWLEMKPQCKDKEIQLDVRFVGLVPDQQTPLAFAFYVKAQSCAVGSEVLKPKSLRRFQGEEKRIQLGPLTLASKEKHKVQCIPLAGEGCFWDCEFLIFFEIHPWIPQASFFITVDS